jgi:hypothetical protein
MQARNLTPLLGGRCRNEILLTAIWRLAFNDTSQKRCCGPRVRMCFRWTTYETDIRLSCFEVFARLEEVG